MKIAESVAEAEEDEVLSIIIIICGCIDVAIRLITWALFAPAGKMKIVISYICYCPVLI